jgi:hypothetical protein
MTDDDHWAFLIFIGTVLFVFGIIGFSIWSDYQITKQCISAGMIWEDGDCIPNKEVVQ